VDSGFSVYRFRSRQHATPESEAADGSSIGAFDHAVRAADADKVGGQCLSSVQIAGANWRPLPPSVRSAARMWTCTPKERRLISVLRGADAETRAQICWVLGSRRKRSAVPTLIELLRDPDVLVRVAALRGLGEIGDGSSVNAVERLTASKDTVVQTVATSVLKRLIHAQGSALVGRSRGRK
jgi:hypothetical protein